MTRSCDLSASHPFSHPSALCPVFDCIRWHGMVILTLLASAPSITISPGNISTLHLPVLRPLFAQGRSGIVDNIICSLINTIIIYCHFLTPPPPPPPPPHHHRYLITISLLSDQRRGVTPSTGRAGEGGLQ